MGGVCHVVGGQASCHVDGAVWSEPFSMEYGSAQAPGALTHHGC